MASKFYVGRKPGLLGGTIFKSETIPTEKTHGHLFTSVIGPFRTKRAAILMASCGHGNPHLQHVRDAERIAALEP